jgi:hypothetical protein
MTGVADLNGQQFSQYRGLPLGGDKRIDPIPEHLGGPREVGVDIHDDEHVLSKIRGRNPAEFDDPSMLPRYPLYGQNWTDDHETARQFATNQGINMGRHRGGLKNVREPYNGVVIEARTNTPPEPRKTGYAGDRQVVPARRDLGEITEVVAHVHRFEPIPEGTDLTEYNRRRKETFVRSFTVPEEHWRNA